MTHKISAGETAERCSALAEHCSAAAERNTTIKWESAGATAERCSANDATEDWQNVFCAAARKYTTIKWEKAGAQRQITAVQMMPRRTGRTLMSHLRT
jgi:hypothetical protein